MENSFKILVKSNFNDNDATYIQDSYKDSMCDRLNFAIKDYHISKYEFENDLVCYVLISSAVNTRFYFEISLYNVKTFKPYNQAISKETIDKIVNWLSGVVNIINKHEFTFIDIDQLDDIIYKDGKIYRAIYDVENNNKLSNEDDPITRTLRLDDIDRAIVQEKLRQYLLL